MRTVPGGPACSYSSLGLASFNMLSKSGDTAPRGTETVLLISADAESRKLAAFMMEKQGYTVLEARDHVQAQRIYVENREIIDLVVTDVAMPGANGKELADGFLEGNGRLRVLFVSGKTSPTGRLLREAGVAVLEKPFTMRDLAAMLREVLDAPRTFTAG